MSNTKMKRVTAKAHDWKNVRSACLNEELWQEACAGSIDKQWNEPYTAELSQEAFEDFERAWEHLFCLGWREMPNPPVVENIEN